ncbi:MAG TPA: sulfurtransferase TusA family protein [Caulobacteraceae bacterium]
MNQPITVDARGHRCPTPTLRLRRALEAAEIGACIRLLADDPMARIDVPLFVREAGHDLIETGETGAGLSFLVRKLSSSCPDAAPAPAPA